jgi:hypothetical protein
MFSILDRAACFPGRIKTGELTNTQSWQTLSLTICKPYFLKLLPRHNLLCLIYKFAYFCFVSNTNTDCRKHILMVQFKLSQRVFESTVK